MTPIQLIKSSALGPALTLAAIGVVATLAKTPLAIPNPPAILLFCVVYAAFRGGMMSGLVSALLAWLYFVVFFSEGGFPLHFTDENLRRIVVWAFTTPGIALMVGALRRGLEQALRRELDEHQAAQAARRDQDRLRSTQLRVSALLVEAESFDVAAGRLLRTICEEMSWQVGMIWVLDSSSGLMVNGGIGPSEFPEGDEFLRVSREGRFARGEDLPGTVWARGELHWLDDVTKSPDFSRARQAMAAGLHAAMAFPVKIGGEVAGVVEFFSRGTRAPDPLLMELMSGTGLQIGQFLRRKRAENDLQKVLREQKETIARRTEDLSASNAKLRHEMAEREQMAHQLSISREQLRLIMDSVPPLISYIDRSQRYTFVNKAYERWFGRSMEHVVGRHMREVLGDSAYEVIAPAVRSALAGVEVTFESTVPYQDGGTRHVLCSYVPDVDQEGVTRGFMALVTDITQSKKARDAARFLAMSSETLASSLDYTQTLANVAKLAIPSFADWCVVHLPDAGGALRPFAIAHRDGEKIRHLKALDPCDAAMAEVSCGGAKACRMDEAVLVPEASASKLEELSPSPEYSELLSSLGLRSYIRAPLAVDDRLLGVITFAASDSGRVYEAEDLEVARELARRAALAIEHARLYKELDAANRAKDAWIATVSHELRTPMNVIGGWVDMLSAQQVEKDERAEVYRILQRNIRVQNQLIEDLLDFSRIATGNMQIETTRVSLPTIAQDVLDSLRLAADAKGVALTLTTDGKLAPVWGDADRLRQVMFNLVSNGIKFTSHGGHVHVTLRTVGARIKVEVRDTGIGIAPEFLPYVFDRLRQEDSRMARRFGGLGLGLAISKHLIEMHGGTIKAYSDGKGKGARFVACLPRAPSAARHSEKALPRVHGHL